MTWADLHGEDYDPRRQQKEKDNVWCRVCCDWIPNTDLKIWTGDDAKHYLCPDCDSDLREPEAME